MSLDPSITVNYKNKFCIINFILGSIALFIEFKSGVNIPTKSVIGLFFLFLLPFLWDLWLYENMFETQKSRQIISYKAFLVIGLIMVLGVFSGIMAVLIEDLFTLEKTLNVRWLLMASFFFGAFTFVRLRAK